MSRDPLQVSLHDEELTEEIQLLADLILAASEWTERMCADEVNRILRLR